MGKAKKSNKKREYNGMRSVAPEVFKDKKSENLLSFKKKEYDTVGKGNKTRNRKVDQGLLKPAKKARVYTEKELGIPKLNTALNPVGVKVKGKKGKKFVSDDKMALILAEVNEEQNAVRASKLERARQLEEIRNLKRQEIEEKEQENKERLEQKKSELKGKKGRGVKGKKSMDAGSDKPIKVGARDSMKVGGKAKKGVRFA